MGRLYFTSFVSTKFRPGVQRQCKSTCSVLVRVTPHLVMWEMVHQKYIFLKKWSLIIWVVDLLKIIIKEDTIY